MATENDTPEEKYCVALKTVDIVQCVRCTENKHIRMKRVKIHNTMSKKRQKTRRKGDNFLSSVDGKEEKRSVKLNSPNHHSSKENKEPLSRHSQVQKTGMVKKDHREDHISGRKNIHMFSGDDRDDLDSFPKEMSCSRRYKNKSQKFDCSNLNHNKHAKGDGFETQRKEKHTRSYISIQYETSRERTRTNSTKAKRVYNGLLNENVNIMENGIFYRARSERRQKNIVKIKPNSSPESSLTKSVEVVENIKSDRSTLGSNRYKYIEEPIKRSNDHKRITIVKLERPNDRKSYNTSKSKVSQETKSRDSDIEVKSHVLSKNVMKKDPEMKIRSTRSKFHNIDRFASSDEDDADEVLKLVQMEIQKQYKKEEAVKMRSLKGNSERGTVYKVHQTNNTTPEVKVQNKKPLINVEIGDQCRKSGIIIIPKTNTGVKENSNNKTGDSVFEFQVVTISDKELKKEQENSERNVEENQYSVKDCSEKSYNPKDIPLSIIDIQDIGVNLHPPHHKDRKFKVVRAPSKRDKNKMVKVGGGWSNINHYYERHEPVRRFEYNRSSTNMGQSFLSFRSHYKFPANTKHKPKAKNLSEKNTIKN